MPHGWRANYFRYKEFFLNIVAVYRRREDVKAFLELLFSLATVSIFVVFALKPTLVTITQLIKDNQTKRETITTMDTKIKNLGIAQGLLSQNGNQIALIESAVPTNALPETFVRQIEGLVQNHSVSLLGISINEVTLKGQDKEKQKKQDYSPLPSGAKELRFSISVSGDYGNLSTLLSDLEIFRRPPRVDMANLNATATENGKSLVLVINGRTVYLGSESVK